MTCDWKQVDKAAFDAWLAAYPRQLERDVAGMYEPPLLTYNDFTLAPMWPESIVAKVILHEGSNSARLNEYFVLDVSSSTPYRDAVDDVNGIKRRET